jgi:Na+/H+ antiporter NhaD/arsenite permease-like protein
MWLIAACCCIFMYLSVIGERIVRHRPLSPVGHSLLRAPFDVAPFVLSMFVLVLALSRVGVTDALSRVLLGKGEILRTGVASFLALMRSGLAFIPTLLIFSAAFGLNGILLAQPVADMLSGLVCIPFILRLFLSRKIPGNISPWIVLISLAPACLQSAYVFDDIRMT